MDPYVECQNCDTKASDLDDLKEEAYKGFAIEILKTQKINNEKIEVIFLCRNCCYISRQIIEMQQLD